MARHDDNAEIWGDDSYQFQGQRSNEKVLLVRNQHPVVLWLMVVIALASLVIVWAILRFVSGTAMMWWLAAYLTGLGGYLWQRLYCFRASVMILSNERIINVNQSGVFNRTINEAELSRIQDVSSEIRGPLQTMFRYGTVTVRTASNDTRLVIRNIVDPYGAQQAVVRALKEAG